MTTPHTDAEVLSGAIEILEKEGAWCQGRFYATDGNNQRLSYCAEGAIRQAAGFWDWISILDQVALVDGDLDNVSPAVEAVYEQCRKLDKLVVDQVDDYLVLNFFNDADATSKSDVLLAMKKALNEVEDL